MNKTLTSISLIFLIFTHPAWAQQQRVARSISHATPTQATATHEPDRAKLKAQAEEVAKAFLSGNFDKLADLTYPDLVRRLGGKTQMMAHLEHDVQEMKAEGFEFMSDKIGEPTQIIRSDAGRTLAVLPTTLRIKIREGVLVGNGYLIGVSDDGSDWRFIDGSSIDKPKLRVLFGTDIVDKLNLPELQQPVLERP
jgi:hypothetical protein